MGGLEITPQNPHSTINFDCYHTIRYVVISTTTPSGADIVNGLTVKNNLQHMGASSGYRKRFFRAKYRSMYHMTLLNQLRWKAAHFSK